MKFKYIMLVLALAVAGCAAYFSVWGLSQLFAGASGAVIIMASILEIGKIVTTTALHKYWDKLAKGLRVYLTISVVILMIITSAGIYGFLSNAYQKTANKLEIHDGELSVLEGKKMVFENSLASNQKVIDSKTKRVEQLSDLRTTQETRLDGSTSNRSRNSVRGDIAGANSEIQKLSSDIDELNIKNSVLSDSISSYNVKALETKAGSDIAGEVGPLKYVAELTGVPMANIVNYMILLLIFVFDPLAVALVLITNRVFMIENEEGEKKTPNPIIEEMEVIEPEEVKVREEVIEELEEIIEEVEEYHEEPEPEVVDKLDTIRAKHRGFSVDVPEPKTNNIVERIGSNKIVRNDDNNKVFYKRKQ